MTLRPRRRGLRDRSLTHLIEGSSQIGKERFEGGFDVSEVQSAFNDLEEAMWRRVVAEVPPEGLFGGTNS